MRGAEPVRLALVIYRYFPFGGLQRDFHRILLALQERGHACRVYCRHWEGEPPGAIDLRRPRSGGLTNHDREWRFAQWVRADLAADPVAGTIGFMCMPGLDICFAGDLCYRAQARAGRGAWYRRTARFRRRAALEEAVFGEDSATHALLVSATQLEGFREEYATPAHRLHLLPPGVARQRRAPSDTPAVRRQVRDSLMLEESELVLLFVGSDFAAKGLDRALTALARTLAQQPSLSARLLVAGAGRARPFKRLARRLKVAGAVRFLGGREDVLELMLAADLLVHPARREAGGAVLLEALSAGLPVVTTADCGHAPHVSAARAGIVLPSPFEQAALDRAVMRHIDGIFRAECRDRALRYADSVDLYTMHAVAARRIETLLRAQRRVAGD